jgi:predicted esterase
MGVCVRVAPTPVRTAVVPVALLVVALAASLVRSQELPTGQLMQHVPSLSDPRLGYSLYLPRNYSPAQPAPLLLGFHYEGQGQTIVEAYRAAAERYGYVVAASNDSRNGVWSSSTQVAQVMVSDVLARFAIDPRRVYLTGLSGGSRLALQVALGNRQVAGVIASSAGFPDAQPRRELPFPVFATAGTLDFNYIEMRAFDAALKTPHRLALFEGGHVLPPPDVAMAAIEWLELEAMKSGRRPRDEAFVDRQWHARLGGIDAAGESAAAIHLLRAAAEDFAGLRDVAELAARTTRLASRADVKTALDRERRNDLAEADLLNTFVAYEVALADPSRRDESLVSLRSLLSALRAEAASPSESPERARARRVLEVVSYAPHLRVRDEDYLAALLRPIQKR